MWLRYCIQYFLRVSVSRTCSSGTTVPLSSQSAANRGRGADRTMACGLIRFFRSQTGGLDSALSIKTRSRTMNWFHGSQTDRIWDKNGARWNNRVTEIPPTARRSKLVGKTKIRTHFKTKVHNFSIYQIYKTVCYKYISFI